MCIYVVNLPRMQVTQEIAQASRITRLFLLIPNTYDYTKVQSSGFSGYVFIEITITTSSIIKISARLVPYIKDAVGWVFKKWAASLTATKLAGMITGGLISITANSFLNSVVENIDIFLSFGGLFAGWWDYKSDNDLNGKIKLW